MQRDGTPLEEDGVPILHIVSLQLVYKGVDTHNYPPCNDLIVHFILNLRPSQDYIQDSWPQIALTRLVRHQPSVLLLDLISSSL